MEMLFDHKRENPPSVGGINLEDALLVIVGLVGTAIANDRLIFPWVFKLAGNAIGDAGTIHARIANGLSTLGTAVVAGILVSDVKPAAGKLVALGGGSLGVGRIALAPVGGNVSVVVPGFAALTAPQTAPAAAAATTTAQGALPPATPNSLLNTQRTATTSPSSYL